MGFVQWKHIKSPYKITPVGKRLQDGNNWKFRWRCNNEIQYIKCYSLICLFCSFSCCYWDLPMPEEQLHQQNHSSETEAENFPTVLQEGFLKTHLLRGILLRGPAAVQGDALSETFVQILSCGIPLSFYVTCIKSSRRQPCWLQQVVSAWICAFWPLEVVREREKKCSFPPDSLLPHPRAGFSLGPLILSSRAPAKFLHIPCMYIDGILTSQLFQIYQWQFIAF